MLPTTHMRFVKRQVTSNRTERGEILPEGVTITREIKVLQQLFIVRVGYIGMRGEWRDVELVKDHA